MQTVPTARTSGRCLAALALAALVIAGCGGSAPLDTTPTLAADGTPVLATWTLDTLSTTDFEAAYAATDGQIEDTTQTPLARRRDFLQRYVDFQLKVAAARAAGYDRDSSYRAEVEDYRDQLAGPYFTDREILDGIIRDIYEKQKERVQVSHVLVRVDANAAPADTLAAYNKALAIRDSVAAGQLTFADAALRNSDDPSARQAGGNGYQGDLGFITGGMTVLPFEDAAYDTPVGELGGPVRTMFGYHIVQVTDRQPAEAEITASHILIRPAGGTAADTAAARQTIEQLRARVVAGEDFAALAREFSDDQGSGAKGGDLGAFGRGRMVPPFEQAAFALREVGELSGPVQSRFGIHLIRLDAVGELPTYEAAYDGIKSRAERLPRTGLKRQAVGKTYFRQAGGTYNEGVVRQALAALPSDSLQQILATRGFPANVADLPFATLQDSTYTVSRLLPVFKRTRIGANPLETYVAAAEAFVDNEALEAAVLGLEDRDPEFRRIFRSYADGVLYFRMAEDSVWTRAKEDEAALRAHFAERRDTYQWPERRRVIAFRSPADSALQVVKGRLDAGTPVAQALDGLDQDRLALRQDTLYVAGPTDSALDAVLDLQVGETTGILGERRRLAVYRLDGIEAPRAKTFDEARAEVISGYQDTLEREWEARLRTRYDARVYPERVTPVAAPVLPERVEATN